MQINSKKPGFVLKIIVLTLLASGIFSCAGPAPEKASQWPHAVNYEIFVRSFCDSSGDGIGDIRGMTSRLDYLADLGIEGIWLMPVHPSSSYHKYNVEDYYEIHPDYGTLDDFREFVEEAHKRGIRVVIDMVINHSGSGHQWFRDVIENGKESPYHDYYIWAHGDTLPRHIERMAEGYPDYGRRNRWNNLRGTEYWYYSYFGRSMPQLNYDNPAVRQEVFEIGRFWLEEIGVDGFRLDAARHIYPENRVEDIHRFWEEYREEMLSVRGDVYLLGEVWASAPEVAPFLNGLPALFNFDLSEAIQRAVTEEKEGGLVEDHLSTLNHYLGINPEFIDATFITNHDQNRIMSVVGGDHNRARMAAALLFTLPGSPYVYYGEETGMLGTKPDPNIREGFLWDVDSLDGCRPTWKVPVYNTDNTVTPLALQMKDESSLFSFYRELIRLRNYSHGLARGDLQATGYDADGLVAFTRDHNNESLLVLHNISGSPVSLDLAAGHAAFGKVKFASNGSGRNGQSVKLYPYSTVILSK